MAITSQPFVRFTCFNFWLVALGALYQMGHLSATGGAMAPLAPPVGPPLQLCLHDIGDNKVKFVMLSFAAAGHWVKCKPNRLSYWTNHFLPGAGQTNRMQPWYSRDSFIRHSQSRLIIIELATKGVAIIYGIGVGANKKPMTIIIVHLKQTPSEVTNYKFHTDPVHWTFAPPQHQYIDMCTFILALKSLPPPLLAPTLPLAI